MKASRHLSLLWCFSTNVLGFQFSSYKYTASLTGSKTTLFASEDLENLKEQLEQYLEKRNELNADEAAKQEVGKVVGGTRGNKILDFVSGAPVKEQVLEEPPNVFDYDELTRYGYGHLVTPIMNAGGRTAVYPLMGMEIPPPPRRAKPKSAPKLIIDRTGETDKGRYSGLKMGQVLDDETMAKALEEARLKEITGQRLRPKIEEEDYVPPFADRRNAGPQLTPDWTPEKLDEYAKSQGRAQAWARRAKMGEFVGDPFEILAVEGGLRIYAIMAAVVISFSFGRATPSFLERVPIMDQSLIGVLQAPALAMVLAAVGSSVVCAVLLAPPKNRSAFVWGVKGFFGGPVAISELRQLDTLVTREELEASQQNQ